MSEPTELTVAITLLRQRIGAELVADIIAKIRTALDEALAEGERRGREAERANIVAVVDAKAAALQWFHDEVVRVAPNFAADCDWREISALKNDPRYAQLRNDTITSLDVLARIERETTGEGE